MWVARRELLVDGERRQPGEPVPEAETWPNRQFYANLGWLGWIEEVDQSADLDHQEPTVRVQPRRPDRASNRRKR